MPGGKMMTDPLQALHDAIDGLDYPSESDAPFELIDWPAGATAEQRVRAACGQATRISEINEDEFFHPLASTADAARFDRLRQMLRKLAGPLSVFRAECGDSIVRIFILGQTSAGRLAGVQTSSVET
jgi:hypothetical protein